MAIIQLLKPRWSSAILIMVYNRQLRIIVYTWTAAGRLDYYRSSTQFSTRKSTPSPTKPNQTKPTTNHQPPTTNQPMQVPHPFINLPPHTNKAILVTQLPAYPALKMLFKPSYLLLALSTLSTTVWACSYSRSGCVSECPSNNCVLESPNGRWCCARWAS